MLNSSNNVYKYFLYKEKKIFNFEDRSSDVLFLEYNNVEVAYLNVVDAFQKKYTSDEIKSNQVAVDGFFNELILPIKEVLIYFSRNQLNINMSDIQIKEFFNSFKQSDIIDIDGYCNIIAEKVRSDFTSFIVSGKAIKEVPLVYQILFKYFDELWNSFAFRQVVPDTWITLCDIDGAIHFFFSYFCRLLKMQQIFNSFFFLLLNDHENEYDSILSFSKFFLSYEYNVLFDIILHIKHYEEARNSNGYVKDVWINYFPSACISSSTSMLSSFFSTTSSSLFSTFIPLFNCSLFPQVELVFKDSLLENSSIDFENELEKKYLGSVFTASCEKQYQALCHDAFDGMVDFKYILSMVTSFKCGSYMHQVFLNNLLNSINA